MPLTVTDLYRYPVKSCRGDQLAAASVEPWGLAGDRRWMIVDLGGEVVTARERPRLVLVTPLLTGGGLRLTGPDGPDLTVSVPAGDELIPVTVWDSKLLAAPAGAAADAWFSRVTGEPARLVYLDDPTRRRPNPDYSRAGDRVSFADGYPLLLTTDSSLAALNEEIAAGPRAAEGPLPMRRFRPSVVVTDTAPWAEDGWRLAAHRRGDVPRGQGVRPVRADHHRSRHRGHRQGADRDAGQVPALGRQGLVRDQPDPRRATARRFHPGRRPGPGPGAGRPGRRPAALTRSG